MSIHILQNDSSHNVMQQLSNNARQTVPQAAGNKRKSDESNSENLHLSDIDCDGMVIDQNCDQVRRRIRRHLDYGAKVGEFCKAIGVSNKSLNDFLRQNGPYKGSGSATFTNAWEFFKKQEIAGVKIPNKKQKSNGDGTTTSSNAGTGVKEADNAPAGDISSINLPGEDFDGVPVYDSCDEVRRKIDTHLRKPGVTQAGFCRDLQGQLNSATGPARIQSNMLTAFRSKKGPNSGNTSSVYYAAYVYFEKARIQQGLGKSKHRLEMERIWPGGVDRERPGNRGYLCGPHERPHEDRFGRVDFY